MAQTKQCFKCGEEKALTEFYKHPQMKDGRLNKCKSCNKKDVQENRKGNIDYYREYDRKRSDDEDRVRARKEYAKKMKNDPESKRKAAERSKEYREKYAIRRGAHVLWGNALKAGRVKMGSECENCGETDGLHAHHEDYTKPLETVTLCRKCHGQRHREINEMKRNGIDLSHKGF